MIVDLSAALHQLVSYPLTRILSAGTMPMFSFGELQLAPSPRGGSREVGTFELHVQCPWRLVYNSSILFGSADYYAETDDSASVDSKAYDDVVKKRISHVLATMSHDDLTVTEIRADELGGFQVFFRCGVFLEVFPAAYHETENWRLFRTGDRQSHVVCTSSGNADPDM